MQKKDRDMASRLESIVSRHEERQLAIDARAIADLRTAGFIHIDTMADAYERRDAQRDLPGFTQAQIDVVLYRRNHEKRVA